jgi:hypothetical protein
MHVGSIVVRTDSNTPEPLNQIGIGHPTFPADVSHIPDNPNLHASSSRLGIPFPGF